MPSRPGSVEDALANTLRSRLAIAAMPRADAGRVLGVATGDCCTFKRRRETDPVLWIDAAGKATALKLNGVLQALEAGGEAADGNLAFQAPAPTVVVRSLGEEADWRADAQLVFEREPGTRIGYRGFYGCAG